MIHMSTLAVFNSAQDMKPISDRIGPVLHSVLLVRDDDKNDQFIETICEFLEITVEYASGVEDLGPMLRAFNPIAVITELEGLHQDGFHVMKIAANHDEDMPVLLLTDGDPALLGAVDAMREVCGLTRVATVSGADGIASLVDFLCHAARRNGMSSLMRT